MTVGPQEPTTNRDPGLPVCEEEVLEQYTQACFIYNGTPSAPLKIRRKNVILFGANGVGKSSLINLMAGCEIAETSSSIEGCTLQATKYSFTLSSLAQSQMSFSISDTAGIEDSEMGISTSVSSVEKAQELVKSLRKDGGIDLLLFCVKAGRCTASMQRNYRLFAEILCDNRVPLALVITHLESEGVMENWWQRNEKAVEKYGINAVAHACITTLPAHVTTSEKWVQSQGALQKLFQDALSSTRNPSYSQAMRNRLVAFFLKPISFLTRSKKRSIVATKLEEYCSLPRGEAKRLANLIIKR